MGNNIFKFQLKVYEDDHVTNIFDFRGDKKKVKKELDDFIKTKC